ncbi:MAG: 50S ribosomal protein L11 methyltransferase [Bacteroidota bacterium]
MMDYWKYELHTSPETSDMLMAFLSDAPFDTFEEIPNGLAAYLPADASQQDAERLLQELNAQFEFSWEKTLIPGQNWNELWESNFNPVIVDEFCAVRADFHAPNPNVRFDLVINPKMAFGTGHHETTYMCLAALEHLPLAGAHVLDYGCGTGILAILASKLGASELEAVDIELESYHNTIENCEVNHVKNVVARCGTLSDVQGSHFDGILANINRNVILDSLTNLYAKLKPGAWLLCSGILIQDENVITEAAEKEGLTKLNVQQRGNWLCIRFQK